jgi:hypothetical protein
MWLVMNSQVFDFSSGSRIFFQPEFPDHAKIHGPGRTRVENGAVKGGNVHANCVGQPGSVAEFRQIPVGL